MLRRLARSLAAITVLFAGTSDGVGAPVEKNSFETKLKWSFPMDNTVQVRCGKKAPIEVVPWQFALRIKDGTRCGAAIVGTRHLLTAAHCVTTVDEAGKIAVMQPDAVEARYGSSWLSGGNVAPVLSIKAHKDWRGKTNPNSVDAALIELGSPSPGASDYPQPIPVRSSGPPGAIQAWIAGWGPIKPYGLPTDQLSAGKVDILDEAGCRAKIPADYAAYVNSRRICTWAPTVNPCVGDSGGAIVAGTDAHPQLLGIMSQVATHRCEIDALNRPLIGIATAGSALGSLLAGVPGVILTEAPPAPLFELPQLPGWPDPHCNDVI